jgi:hypothetical protein
MKPGKAIALISLPLALVLIASLWAVRNRTEFSSDRMILLLPDDMSTRDPQVTMWLDAASEEGLQLIPVHDSAFVRPLFRQSKGAGVILPDSIHQRVSDVFLTALKGFVSGGGRLLLVYDAGTLLPNGRYAPYKSRLSDLAGVSYALYDTLADKTMQWSPIRALDSTFDLLNIPPGKYYPFRIGMSAPEALPAGSAAIDSVLRRYKYGDLEYPSFATSGRYEGNVLLHSSAGVVAGEHLFEKGSVLFVNLPLSSLKGKTDGLMLHAFLTYFAFHTLALPRLLAVPDGIGGIVLNWHIDSNAAIKPLEEIASWGLLKQGPYSVHITAGPDTFIPGDHRGFNVANNLVGQTLIRKYLDLGYTIGSHGGWIHNYFASHVATDDPASLEKYLVWNKGALEQITGTPVVEYSAPDGNQPIWVTHWLEAHGFVAYYFTGDSGMGPTQGYRRGIREGANIWAFPILHLDRAAAFEELSQEGYPAEEVEGWLEAVTAFTIGHHLARLIYFHPPGILAYHDVVEHWLQMTGSARDRNTFRWYTMTELAHFLNRRKYVQWRTAENDGVLKISAADPDGLAHFAWQLPATHYDAPEIVEGNATVAKDGNSWIVVANSGSGLEFTSRVLHP